MTTRKLIQSALFVTLITLGAIIKIPVGIIPITLQLFMVFMLGFTLDPKQCLYTMTAYVIMGLIGLPVFSGGGGLDYILRPSFGYLIGFIFSSYSISKTKTKFHPIIVILIGYLILYVCGLGYAYILQNFILNTKLSFITLFSAYWFVFLPSDITTLVIVYIIHKPVQKIIKL